MKSLFKSPQPKSYGNGFDVATRKADVDASAQWWMQNSLVPFARYDEHEERAPGIAA